MTWTKCSDRLPPEHEIVDTKVDDKDGVRNEQRLYRVNGLWFPPGYPVMYVYYQPTHWRARK